MILFFIIIFGLCFGSFGSVLLCRLNQIQNLEDFKYQIKSIMVGRSKCPNCNTYLGFLDLFPILSFLRNRWKCRYCHTKISIFYPVLEVWSAIVFLLSYCLYICIFPDSFLYWQFFLWAMIFWVMWLIIFQDIRTMDMNLILWFLLLLLSISYNLFFIQNIYLTLFFVIGCLIIFLLVYWFWILWVRFRKFDKKLWLKQWFGEWDVLMSLIIWLLLPILSYQYYIPASFFYVFYILLIYLVLVCILGILFFVIQQVLAFAIPKYIKRNLIKIPFLPSMILWLWILIVFFGYFISL